jgi:Ca2+-binding RTX toxin-like protein
VSGTILNDDFLGTAAGDTIVGSAFADKIDGQAGGDVLTGLAGSDLFHVRFSQSTLLAPDRITDFTIAADKIKPQTADGVSLPLPLATRAQDDNTSSTLAQLSASVYADANGALDGPQPLVANSAALVVATNPAIAGTYVLINDATATLSTSSDTLINITGFQGDLPAFGSFTSSLLFV